MIPGGWLGILAVGIILGALGQGARAIVGIKKLHDYADDRSAPALVDGLRLLISFGIGGVAGAFAAMTMFTPTAEGTIASASQLLGVAAAGYAGADFIEGFTTRISGGQTQTQSGSTTASTADDAVG
jgi:hypothetical protein